MQRQLRQPRRSQGRVLQPLAVGRQQLVGTGQPGPGVAVRRLEVRPGRNFLLQLALVLLLAGKVFGVAKTRLLADKALDGVFQAQPQRTGSSRLLLPAGRVGQERRPSRLQRRQLQRICQVALIAKLRHRQSSAGGARMPDDQGQLTSGHRLLAKLQEVLGTQRLVAVVDSQQRKVEREPRIGKVVVVTAECRRLLLGGKHQAHIGVATVQVQHVLTAAVQGHDLGHQATLCRRLFFKVGNRRLPRRGLVGRAIAGLDRALHLRRYIRQGPQQLGLQVWAR